MQRQRMTTFGEAARMTIERRWKGTRSEETQSMIARELEVLLGTDTRLANISRERIERDLVGKWKSCNLGSSTINRKRAVFMVIMQTALAHGAIKQVPYFPPEKLRVMADGRKEGRRDRYLTQSEQERLFEQLDEDHLHFSQWLLATGMRPSEALRIKWKNVDPERKIIHVDRSKTGRSRTIPLSPAAMAALPDRDHEELPVWGWFITHRTYNTHFSQARRAAGLGADVVPYVLRHTFATRMVQQGCPLHTLQQIMGHASIQTTMIYAHHTPEAMETARRFMP